MSAPTIPICPVCGQRLPPAPRRGRPRVYCSDRCRKKDERRRSGSYIAVSSALKKEPRAPSTPTTDEQVARALLEARGLAGAFLRLGHEARPAFAWRCELIGLGLHELIDKHFEGADHG